ncbi:MAG TPA: DUF885 domain-containing protein [Gemmatimonadaceae bacterium]|nr:DUF885 domain-containing protein [Gemmatimonadaceae bacterium]
MRVLPPVCLAALAACAPAATVPPLPTPSDPAARITALADAFVAGLFERAPEVATYFGVAGRRHDALQDNSLATLARYQREDEAWLAQVRRIDPTPLLGRPEWATYAILRELLEAAAESRVCRGELWGLNQLTGWQAGYAYLAGVQPVGTDDLRSQALARWRQLPRFIDIEIANLREGLRLGYTAPRGNVELVAAQIDGLAGTAPEESPFYAPAQSDSTPAFRAAFRTAVADEINPALRRYRDFLRTEYAPRARTTIAIASNPDGERCYRAAVRANATLDVPPREIHELGLREMARIEGEMRTIAERSFGTSDVPRLLERLRTDTAYTFRTREEVIAYSQAAVDRARRAMPRWFGIVPKADVVIERYPSFRERSAVGEYNAPAEDGTRPGVFLISTYEPTKRSKSGPESVAFHETIPGHHLQTAIALERKDRSHPIARYVGNSGFAEGWALYAERLADEMGLFSSDLDRMGMLSEQALRAARLVIDPGIHALGWTRDQAIEYLASHTTAPREEAISEVDRYIIMPGQATSYMLGMLEIQRLRDAARRGLGPRFDIRQFHDRVLEDGSVPLPALRAKIEWWVREGAR